MHLTLNQTLFLVLTIVAVVVAVFLVRVLIQLRRTAQEGERTLAEIGNLAGSLMELERNLNARMDDIGDFLASTKKVAAGLTQAGLFLTTKVVNPASRFLPVLFPLLLMGWRKLKKKKEK
jgi:predicted PurR-regulated permease PerM